MADATEKLAYFQAITGLEDPDLCTEILQAHDWDLELAISSISSEHEPEYSTESASTADTRGENNYSVQNSQPLNGAVRSEIVPAGPGLVWKLVTLPISVVSGSLGLISGAIGLGLWAAGGVLSYSLGMVGLGSNSVQNSEASAQLISVSSPASQAVEFVRLFESEYGSRTLNFVNEGFMDALQRSRNSFKLLFVYLHSPDHPDTPRFCGSTLCSEMLTDFVNEHFVAWGGNIRSSEGYKMSNVLKASRFPFCAVVMPATNQRISLLQQLEGPKSPGEMITVLQRVLEQSLPVLVAARLEAEERRTNIRLREEQDAAYRTALEADQAREQQRREEQEQLEREAAESERKRKEEEAARERETREAAERQAALAKLREEKALALGAEPESGPLVTRVLLRFPKGERRERRFHSSAPVQNLYDYVDSLGCLDTETYSLVSNFPRVVYGTEKKSVSLKEAGLHPQASLFVELK